MLREYSDHALSDCINRLPRIVSTSGTATQQSPDPVPSCSASGAMDCNAYVSQGCWEMMMGSEATTRLSPCDEKDTVSVLP